MYVSIVGITVQFRVLQIRIFYLETLVAIHLRCRRFAQAEKKNTKRETLDESSRTADPIGPRDTRGTFVRHFRTCRAIVFPSIPAWKALL